MSRRRLPKWADDLIDGVAFLILVHGLLGADRRRRPTRPIEPMPRRAERRPNPTTIRKERLLP